MHNNMGDKFHEGFTTIGGYEENKGYINKIGEIVIPQIHKDAGNFSGGLAAVHSVDTELWGYIDKDGELVIPMIYNAAAPFREEAAYVVKDGLAGYIDKDGNDIIDFTLKPETNKYVDNSFYGGLAIAQDSSGKYGYIDKNGDFVIPAKYKEANPFIGEAAFVVRENQNYLNGYGSSFLMNRDGERLTPLWQYGRYSGEYMREGLIRALSTYGPSLSESIVILNKDGAEVIPSSLNIKYLSSFNEGYAMLIAHNNDDTAVGLVKIPENIESYNDRKIIRVFIDDKLLDFEDTDPIIENSRTLVPMRAIFEALGAEVEWDDANKTALATKDDITVSLKIDDNIAHINNEPVELDVPARIKNSRTLVPIRFIAESLNANVTWDDTSRAVIIDTSSDIPIEEKTQIENLVKNFGENLKKVSLMAPKDIVNDSLKENYGEFVSTALLEKWQNDPVNAPGRGSSSPWPERIDIVSVEKLSDSEYVVNGSIIKMTSVEMTQGGIAGSKPVTLNIKKVEDKWLIDDYTYSSLSKLIAGYMVIEDNLLYLDEVEIITREDKERIEELILEENVDMPGGYHIYNENEDIQTFELTNETSYTFVDYNFSFVKNEDGDRVYTTTKKEDFIQHLNKSYSDLPPAQKVPFFVEVKDGRVISITEKIEYTI